MAKKRSDLVEVEWLDSSSTTSGSAWVDKKSAKAGTPITCRSAGILIKKTKTYVIVAAHDSGYQVSGDLVIPRFAITRMRHLK